MEFGDEEDQPTWTGKFATLVIERPHRAAASAGQQGASVALL